MNWVLVPQAIVTGVLNGGIIGLIALGVVLIYKSSEIYNFAQGYLLVLGAYVTWWFARMINTGNAQIDLILAVVAALIVIVLVGFIIERIALRPMTGQPLLSIILMTLGLALLIDGVVRILFGVQPKSDFPAIISPSETFKIPFPLAFNGVIIIQKLLIVVFGLAVFFSIAFALFFKFTRNGLSMRATSEDHELARSVGINVPRVFGLSWAVAGVVATGGGVLLSMLKGASLSLADVVLVAFPAILLGGLESLPGAMVGGIVVGLTRELVATSKLIEIRNSKDIAPYVLLLIVLLIRPEGLFGQKRIERI
jgi:branched-chain amino acid transport system permease protein